MQYSVNTESKHLASRIINKEVFEIYLLNAKLKIETEYITTLFQSFGAVIDDV